LTVVGTGLALGSEVGEVLELGAELIAGESLGVLLASGVCSADGLEVAFTVVGTGLALGS
jgi:hypothetical protein